MEHETAFGACRFFSLYIQQIRMLCFSVNNYFLDFKKSSSNLRVKLCAYAFFDLI